MTTLRKLSPGYFAFMRSVVQGIDARASWDRYMRLEGEAVDLRWIKTTIGWIRQAFAAAAKRHARPGTARLVLIDVSEVTEFIEPQTSRRGSPTLGNEPPLVLISVDVKVIRSTTANR